MNDLTTRSGIVLSQLGNPPHSRSPQMYGPGRSTTCYACDRQHLPIGLKMTLGKKSTYKPLFLRKLEIPGYIIGWIAIFPFSLLWLKKIPIYIAEDRIQSHGSSFGKSILPILRRDSLRVHLPTNDNIRLSMKSNEWARRLLGKDTPLGIPQLGKLLSHRQLKGEQALTGKKMHHK